MDLDIEDGSFVVAIGTNGSGSLGDRLVLMHRGRVIHDLRGAEKRRACAEGLLARFEEVRRGEQFDEPATEMLRRRHI